MTRKNPYRGALALTLIALAIAAISYFVIKPRQEANEKNKTRSALLYGDLDRQKVVEFKIQNANGTFQVKRKAENNDQWMIVVDNKIYEGDKIAIDGIVSTLLAAKEESAVTNTDFAGIGLNPPKFKLTVNGSASTPAHELGLGEDTPVDYLVYAKWSDKNTAFLTTRSLRFSLDKKLSEIRNKKVFPLKASDLSQIEFKIAAVDKLPARDLNFTRATDGSWKAESPVAVTLDKVEVDKFIDTLGSLAVTDFVSENPADRPKLGFGRPLVTINIKPADAKAQPATWVLAAVKDPKAAPKAPGGGMKYYLARLDQDSTYEVTEPFFENFKTDFFKFRPKTVSALKKSDITGLIIEDGRTQFSFTKDGPTGWKVKAKSGKKEIEGAPKMEAFEKALESVINLKAVEYFDKETPGALGLRQPTRVVELRGLKDGKEAALATLFFGKKLPGDKIVVRTEDLDAAAAVALKVEDVLPMNIEHFVETNASPTGTPAATPNPEGPKKVKLEPTVKNVSELRKLPGPIVKAGHKYTAVITLNNGKTMTITFAPDKAPYTVSNFLHLARNHFYDGVKFHRVIPDFVVQGGDPTGTGTGGPGWKFDNEDNDLKHKRGAISMAHAGRNTNGSQFFLVLKPQPHLDGVHTVFGEITEGLDQLDTIKQGDSMKTVEVFEESK